MQPLRVHACLLLILSAAPAVANETGYKLSAPGTSHNMLKCQGNVDGKPLRVVVDLGVLQAVPRLAFDEITVQHDTGTAQSVLFSKMDACRFIERDCHFTIYRDRANMEQLLSSNTFGSKAIGALIVDTKSSTANFVLRADLKALTAEKKVVEADEKVYGLSCQKPVLKVFERFYSDRDKEAQRQQGG